MPLTNPQRAVADSKARFRVLISGRRFGKTHLAIRELCRFASLPNRNVMYVAPTYRMARQIAWEAIKDKLTGLNWVESKNEHDLSIKLRNGSRIILKGADAADSLRGLGNDFVVIDEIADVNKDVWTHVIRPSLADRKGHCLFAGTPKGVGNWSYDLFNNAKYETDWDGWQFTTLEGGQVDADEIQTARNTLDPVIFRQEFEASFESFEGVIYYPFKRETHVKKYTWPIPSIIYVGVDFNVSPCSAIICVKHGDKLWAIEEILLWNADTHQLAQEIKNRYPTQRVIAFPDPAGRQAKTSAMGKTDISILENEGFVTRYKRRAIPVRDRINAVNSLLQNANGDIRFIVDPTCKMTITALERMSYKQGTNIPDTNNDWNHISDAFGYLIHYEYPIKRAYERAEPQRWAVGLR